VLFLRTGVLALMLIIRNAYRLMLRVKIQKHALFGRVDQSGTIATLASFCSFFVVEFLNEPTYSIMDVNEAVFR